MTKTDLIDELAKALGAKKEAKLAVDAILTSITEALKKGDTVSLAGFGAFKAVRREARKGRNPATGEEIEIKATTAPRFTPAKALKEALN